MVGKERNCQGYLRIPSLPCVSCKKSELEISRCVWMISGIHHPELIKYPECKADEVQSRYVTPHPAPEGCSVPLQHFVPPSPVRFGGFVATLLEGKALHGLLKHYS